jgi:hypothetical protein
MRGEPIERELAAAPAGLARGGDAGAGTPAWKRALPFVIAAALLAFVMARLDLAAVRASLERVNAAGFVGFATAFVLALLCADSFATVMVYRPVLGRIRYRDLFVVRGASYLPSILNHHVGQAFVTVFLARSHGAPLARVAGGTLVVYASWTACLLALGGAAVIATGLPAVWLAAPIGAGVAYLIVLAVRPARLERVALLRPLFEAGVRGHLVAAAARVPHAAVLFAGTWLSLRFFGVEVPVGAALSYVPILMVAVTLPITPQGFGTRDVLAATLLLPFAIGATDAEKRAAIAAATASWGTVLTAVEALLGLLLLRRATRLLETGAPNGAEHEERSAV